MPRIAASRSRISRAVAVLLEPVHAGEQSVVEALHAHREARHAGVAVARQHVGLEVVRVGLDRDRVHGRKRADQVERGDQLVGIHGGRAAAHVHVAEAEAGLVIQADLVAQRREVASRLRLVVAHPVERAERAQHLAERHVHVELARSRRRRGHHLGRVVLVEAHRARVLAAQDVQERAFEPEHRRSVSVSSGSVAVSRRRRPRGRGARRPGRSSGRRRCRELAPAAAPGSHAAPGRRPPARAAGGSGTRRP